MKRLWKVTLGMNGEYETEAFAKNILTIDFDISSDVSYATDRDAFVAMMQEKFPDRKPRTHQNFATQLTQFILEMEEGGLVVCPIKGNRTISIARIVGGYEPSPETGRPTRPVEWVATDVPRETFGQDLLRSFGAVIAVCEVSRNNALSRVEAVLATGEDPGRFAHEHLEPEARRYFLKVNGKLHCPDGVCRPASSSDWEGGEVLVPASGPIFAVEGSRPEAREIQDGDELWIWTHEDDQFGRGWGLTAKATAGSQRQQGEFTAVTVENVERLDRPFGFRDLGDGPTGSRLLDHASAHRHHQAYLIDDEDYAEFVELVEEKSRELSEEVRLSYAEGWEKEVLTHKDDLLAGLQDRKTSTQKARLGQAQFRDALMKRYKGRCVISKCAIPEALEAAHVMPHTGDPKWDHPDNGMLLRRDLHALFDAMLWSIDPKSNRMRLAERLKTTSYRKLDGREIGHQVSLALLEVHFRQFKKGGIDD